MGRIRAPRDAGYVAEPRRRDVISFARALGHDPLEALVAAGYLEATDIHGGVTVRSSVDEITDTELAGEMQRRLVIYGDLAAEMRRRYEADDLRKIEPGSASDVFPRFRDDGELRARHSR